MPRRVLLSITVGTLLLTSACGGGGGQLAQHQQGTITTTTTTASIEPIDTAQLDGPDSVKETARTLRRVESRLRAADRDEDQVDALGREQQLAYRTLSVHPKWAAKVVAAIPQRLRAAVQANIDAGAALGLVTGTAPPGFPDWEIRTPQPQASLRAYYDEAEQAYGVPWAYLAAIHFVETRMGRIHGLSSAGAQGPMQFIPSTWAEYGEGDINDDHDAILAAARYLDANDFASDVDHALFRYNNHESYVAAIKAYASVMLADAAAYDGYYHWQVFYATVDGAFVLPEGWKAS